MIDHTKWSTPLLINDAKANGDTKPAANDTSGGSGGYYDGTCATLKDAVKSGCRKRVKEMETGKKNHKEHDDICPRKKFGNSAMKA